MHPACAAWYGCMFMKGSFTCGASMVGVNGVNRCTLHCCNLKEDLKCPTKFMSLKKITERVFYFCSLFTWRGLNGSYTYLLPLIKSHYFWWPENKNLTIKSICATASMSALRDLKQSTISLWFSVGHPTAAASALAFWTGLTWRDHGVNAEPLKAMPRTNKPAGKVVVERWCYSNPNIFHGF